MPEVDLSINGIPMDEFRVEGALLDIDDDGNVTMTFQGSTVGPDVTITLAPEDARNLGRNLVALSLGDVTEGAPATCCECVAGPGAPAEVFIGGRAYCGRHGLWAAQERELARIRERGEPVRPGRPRRVETEVRE